jgi:autotransporter-associated beta strand protein
MPQNPRIHRAAAAPRRARLAVVRLEDRTVPANLVWTGDVDDRWGTNTLGNTNWAFDMLPHNGDNLLFPASSQHQSNTNNLNGLVVNNLTVASSGFTIAGNAITLTGNYLHSTASATGTFSVPLRLSPGAHNFNIGTTSPGLVFGDNFTGGISDAGGGPANLIKDGIGQLQFLGSGNTYTGLTTISAGDIIVATNPGVAIPGDLVISDAAFTTVPANQIADTAAVTLNQGCFVFLDGQSDTIGPLTIAAGANFNITGFNDQYCDLTAGNTSLASGSFLTMRIENTSSPSDRIAVNGAVQLGATLALGIGAVVPTVGTPVTLIDNDGSDPVIGTFAGLPQGAAFDINNRTFTIDYTGGTGNDVVVTRLPSVMVTGTRINDGSVQRSRITSLTVTFNAPVTFASTPAAAFTLVRNSDNASVAFTATAALVNGVSVVTLTNFGGGSATQFLSLADGRYTLTALASQISSGGHALDGDGDGLPGGNYTFGDAQGLFRFYGDINGDRHVDIADFGLFSTTFGLHTGQNGFLSAFDFNSDGVIDIADFGQFAIRFFTVLP